MDEPTRGIDVGAKAEIHRLLRELAGQGIGAELCVISAAVIGGASLSGGEGTILGAVLKVILLNIINNALILMNVSVYW